MAWIQIKVVSLHKKFSISKSIVSTFKIHFSFRFGFSEFNSDTYAPIAFKGMATLVGLSEDSELKQLAEMVMNLQLFDHIIGSKGGR